MVGDRWTGESGTNLNAYWGEDEGEEAEAEGERKGNTYGKVRYSSMVHEHSQCDRPWDAGVKRR